MKEVEELTRRQSELVRIAIRENEKNEQTVLRVNEERLEKLRGDHQEKEKKMSRENEKIFENLRIRNEESLALMLSENETELKKTMANQEEERAARKSGWFSVFQFLI